MTTESLPSFRLNRGRFKLTPILTTADGAITGLEFRWSPQIPVGIRGQRRRQLLAEYRSKRDDFLAELVVKYDINLAVIDIE